MNTFSDNIERMKSRHVLGTMFCLSASVLYTPLAFASGTNLARQEIQRIPGTLLEQIGGMDAGSIELGAGNDFTITRSDGSQYVVENVALDASGVASAMVSAYDSNGMLTDTAAINRLTGVDSNRVDFQARITPAGGSATTVIGSLTGLRGSRTHTAMAAINTEGEQLSQVGSQAVIVDYSGIDDSAGASTLVTVTSIDGCDDGIQSLWQAALDLVIAAGPVVVVVVIAIVLILVVTCSVFGWLWGC